MGCYCHNFMKCTADADGVANYGLDPRNIELYPTRFMKRGLQESDVIPIPLKTTNRGAGRK
jgi:hypothetical protein